MTGLTGWPTCRAHTPEPGWCAMSHSSTCVPHTLAALLQWHACVGLVGGREGSLCGGGPSVAWCSSRSGEAWVPDAEPTGAMWARPSQPPDHRNMLPGCCTTAITWGQRHAGHDLGGPALLDCLLAQVALP